MKKEQEKEILRWVYAVAQEEYDKIQRVLKWVGEGEMLLEDRIIELLSYQYELKRFMNKIRIRIDQQEELSCLNLKGIMVDSDMQRRADGIKYQIHENRQAGIYAWEIARELINLEEELIKKYQEPWQ